MSYINEITDRIAEKAPDLESFWEDVVREGAISVDSEGIEEHRITMVGIQGIQDAVAVNQAVEGSLIAIVTPNVATPVVVDQDNVDEFIAAEKQATVLPRIETTRDLLDAGHVMIIAAPQSAWDAIAGTSKEEVWNGLNNKYPNLHGVVADVPPGVTGAVNLIPDGEGGYEASGINFPQAQEGVSTDVSGISFCGAVSDDNVRENAKILLKPLEATRVAHHIPKFSM